MWGPDLKREENKTIQESMEQHLRPAEILLVLFGFHLLLQSTFELSFCLITCSILLVWSCLGRMGNPNPWREAAASSAGKPGHKIFLYETSQSLSWLVAWSIWWFVCWRFDETIQRNAKSSCCCLHLQNCAEDRVRKPHPQCLVSPVRFSTVNAVAYQCLSTNWNWK